MELNSYKYKICLHKAYFEKGLSVTSYAKYLIAFFGLASQDIITTLLIGIIYALLCYFLGMYWYKSDFAIAEQEVNNKFNLFVEEMRNHVVTKYRKP
jgi:uncharacterized YccA/Bax inhibitor family protein